MIKYLVSSFHDNTNRCFVQDTSILWCDIQKVPDSSFEER